MVKKFEEQRRLKLYFYSLKISTRIGQVHHFSFAPVCFIRLFYLEFFGFCRILSLFWIWLNSRMWLIVKMFLLCDYLMGYWWWFLQFLNGDPLVVSFGWKPRIWWMWTITSPIYWARQLGKALSWLKSLGGALPHQPDLVVKSCPF